MYQEPIITEHQYDWKVPKVSLREFLNSGKAFVQEMVAKYIAGRHIPPASITSLFSISLNDFDQSNWSSWQLLLCRMLKAFPLSLSSDKLLANCCWEFCALWNSQSESIELLELSVAYLQDISNAVLQHGLATLLWSTFLNGKFQNCTFLVEKVGKYPKDRLCRKDVGVTEDGLLRFVVCCDQLLKTLLAANADYELATPTLVRYEDFLDDIFTDLSSTTTNRQSLIELANLQKCTNYHLVKVRPLELS